MVLIVILVTAVLAVFRLRIAVGRGIGLRRDHLMGHSGGGGYGHGEAAPADEEETEQHSRQETSETHACR
ncbi:hypothetical protein [Azospirillum isscasi]|uniref:Secreted protein n=1 Tax=Azospirillum isscasi TaxID=3053926 RepID=A0ABU0WGN9_9PROT|nr:hypothetical protein [Azospirillum isscasi]MDQ2102784.1 hypothetical protein [Azospirillum isscasi]